MTYRVLWVDHFMFLQDQINRGKEVTWFLFHFFIIVLLILVNSFLLQFCIHLISSTWHKYAYFMWHICAIQSYYPIGYKSGSPLSFPLGSPTGWILSMSTCEENKSTYGVEAQSVFSVHSGFYPNKMLNEGLDTEESNSIFVVRIKHCGKSIYNYLDSQLLHTKRISPYLHGICYRKSKSFSLTLSEACQCRYHRFQ